MIRPIKSFVADEAGATAIEYAVLVTVLTNLRMRLSTEFSGVLK